MNGRTGPLHDCVAPRRAQLGPMIRVGAAMVIGGVLLAGCGGDHLCDGTNCPDVSGTFSLLSAQPQGDCTFASYVPPPTITLTQTDGGRHVTTQLIDPINQLLVPITGSVLERNDDGSGSFRLHTQLLRQATSRSDSQLVTLQLTMNGTVTRRSDRSTLTSQLTEIQLQPQKGAGCQITIALTGQTGTP